MSTIDITKGFRQYAPEDLREYALKGIITAGNYDLSEFLEYLLQGTYSASEVDEAKENSYDEGYEVGKWEGSVDDDTLERFRKQLIF